MSSAPPLETFESAKIVLKYWNGQSWAPFWESPTIEAFEYRAKADTLWNQAAFIQSQAQDRGYWTAREWRTLPPWLNDYRASQYARDNYGISNWDAWSRVGGYILGGPFVEHWALVTEQPPYPKEWQGSVNALRWANAPI